MLILTIRTDKPESEIGLFTDHRVLAHETWEAHRKLAETINTKIDHVLSACRKKMSDIDGVVVYKGPGSFTGLRIGLSVANAVAYSLHIPIVAATGSWVETGVEQLLSNQGDVVAVPDYGAPVHITSQKK